MSDAAVPLVPASRRILAGYFTLAGLYTLSAALIWGVNTLFLLDAGLSFFEVFVANAAFSAGMVVFEVPTGVVADTLGRRVSFLLSVTVLAATTLLYVALAQVDAGVVRVRCRLRPHGPRLHLLLGGDGGVARRRARRERVSRAPRPRLRARAAGDRGRDARRHGRRRASRADRPLAAVSSCARVLLVAVFAIAYVVMHDVGFTPRRVTAGELPGEIARNARAGVEFGWRQPGLRLLMLASFLQMGFVMWAFYAAQPYLLELLDSDAVWVSGVVVRRRRALDDRRESGRERRVALMRAPDDAPADRCSAAVERRRRLRADGIVLGRGRLRCSS